MLRRRCRSIVGNVTGPSPIQALLRLPLLRFLRSSRFCASAAASSASICRILGKTRGFVPEIPKIGCRICCENVNLFGHMQPGKVGLAAAHLGKIEIKNLVFPWGILCRAFDSYIAIVPRARGRRLREGEERKAGGGQALTNPSMLFHHRGSRPLTNSPILARGCWVEFAVRMHV